VWSDVEPVLANIDSTEDAKLAVSDPEQFFTKLAEKPAPLVIMLARPLEKCEFFTSHRCVVGLDVEAVRGCCVVFIHAFATVPMAMFRKLVAWSSERCSLRVSAQEWDLNGDGVLSREEFVQHAKARGLGDKEATERFEEMDVDNSGVMSKNELREFLKIEGATYDSVTDSRAVTYVRNNPDLTEIDLARCRNITDQTVWALTAVCKHVQKLDVSGSEHVTLAAVAGLVAKCQHLGLAHGLKVAPGLRDQISKVTKGKDLKTEGRLAMLIMAMPDVTQIMIPCVVSNDGSITSMVVMALKGLQNLQNLGAESSVTFTPGSAGWSDGAADFSVHSDMKTWMTNKHFSILFSILSAGQRVRSLDLQNTGLSAAVGIEQLARAFKTGFMYLVSLNLANNNLQPRGLKALAAALPNW
jgi:Ca2+-binding EF-hand superfamily protein